MEQKQVDKWFGLDVSRKSFTAALAIVGLKNFAAAPQKSFELNRTGVRQLLRWCRETFPRESFGIAMEATGSYSKTLARLILKEAPGQLVSICKPDKVATTRGASPRTRPTGWTRASSPCSPATTPPRRSSRRRPPEEEELDAPVRERTFLAKQRTQAENRGEVLEGGKAAKIHAKLLKELNKHIEELDKAIGELVEKTPKMKAEIRLMDSVPGIAVVSAAVIYAVLGPLGQYTRNQLSKMSGISPSNRESGTSVKPSRMSKDGDPLLRQIFCLDVTAALRKTPALAELRQRLLVKARFVSTEIAR